MRLFDITLSVIGLIVLGPLLLVLLIIGWFDTRSPLFFQPRVGKNQKTFILVKFRTMKANAAIVATHLADVSAITPWGKILRGTKLDEVPQLWNVLKGEMSLVGPRPNLPTQEELITEREKCHVYQVRPGITGLAQVNNIDMSSPSLLAKTDAQMIEKLNVKTYFKYILMTLIGKGSGDKVSNA